MNERETRTNALSEDERRRILATLDRIIADPPTRPQAEVDDELREICAARHRWARREPR
jgi:hypothetical protein